MEGCVTFALILPTGSLDECLALIAAHVVYSSHIHCGWRNDAG